VTLPRAARVSCCNKLCACSPPLLRFLVLLLLLPVTLAGHSSSSHVRERERERERRPGILLPPPRRLLTCVHGRSQENSGRPTVVPIIKESRPSSLLCFGLQLLPLVGDTPHQSGGGEGGRGKKNSGDEVPTLTAAAAAAAAAVLPAQPYPGLPPLPPLPPPRRPSPPGSEHLRPGSPPAASPRISSDSAKIGARFVAREHRPYSFMSLRSSFLAS
jgi:hypothetical protein